MFKKGQALRNKKTGCVLEVLEWPLVRRVAAPRIGRAPVDKMFTVAFKTRDAFDAFDIIGNNYQAKPKCSR